MQAARQGEVDKVPVGMKMESGPPAPGNGDGGAPTVDSRGALDIGDGRFEASFQSPLRGDFLLTGDAVEPA